MIPVGATFSEEIRHFHLFCGIGGGARGFNDGHARVGRAEARFRCIGGIDSFPFVAPRAEYEAWASIVLGHGDDHDYAVALLRRGGP